MAKIYSITARRMIDVPDSKPAAKVAVADDRDAAQGKVAQQLTGWLLEAEKRITELEAKLGPETAAREAAEAKIAVARAAAQTAEAKATSLATDLEKARVSLERVASDGRVALARAEGATALERAARTAAEQRTVAAELRCKQVESKPQSVIQSGPDIKQIAGVVRAELNARPAPLKPVQLPFEVDITERDANGRIKRFKPRFTS